MKQAYSERLRHFLGKIESVPKLSREQEVELVRRWREDHDVQAGDQVILANLRYAVQIACMNVHSGSHVEDLISASCMGFVYALTKYDERRGNRFVTYAAEWARAYIFRHITRNKSLVQGGKVMRGPYYFAVRRERAKLLAQHGDETLANQQVAEKYKLDYNEMVGRLQSIDFGYVRLDKANHEGYTLVETLVDPGQMTDVLAEENERRDLIAERVRAVVNDPQLFDERERTIIVNRLMRSEQDAEKFEELGARYGVSRQRIQQIEKRVRGKLMSRLNGLEQVL